MHTSSTQPGQDPSFLASQFAQHDERGANVDDSFLETVSSQARNPNPILTQNSDSATLAQTTQSHIEPATPLIALKLIRKGRNPRTFFDPAEMAELIASVKSQGVLQPILVRPVDGGYEIVAGERRYRAAFEAHGEDFLMPVLIRQMSDAEADAAATVENTQRADMSPTEEAAGAAKVVGDVNGDRDEAARVLGWSRTKLDKRLALMNCSAAVQQALNERRITLGHAELLAALAKDKQDKLVDVIIGEKKSVAELKGVIEKAATKLSEAIFDKAECNGCAHNSSIQASMFVESIVDGSCTNGACFRTKTDDVLNAKVASLKDDYPVIRILRAGDNSTLVKLVAEGPKGVGAAQAEACRGCAEFGAAVSSLPQAMGEVYKDRCFNPGCNANKVAARLIAESGPAAAETPKPQPSKSKIDPTEKSGPAKGPEGKSATSVSEGDRIKAYREGVWRKAMKREIATSPSVSSLYLVAICLNGSSRHIDGDALGKAFAKLSGQSKPTSQLGECASALADFTPENLATMTTMLAASAMEKLDVHHLRSLAKQHQLDLTKHWRLDQALLDLLTKSEIEVLAKEIGLHTAFGDGFKKLLSEKKPDMIKGLLAHETFNYSATIPAVLAY